MPVTIATGYVGDFRGAMDQIRIWNSARSGTEIADNLDNTLSGSETGLAAYYQLDEGAGDTAADATANAITATLIGSPAWERDSAATLAAYASQGTEAAYYLSNNVADSSAPAVVAMQQIPAYGHVFDGTSRAPGNMTAQRGNNEQAFLYSLTGSTGGSIWGTDIYTDNSSLAKAAVHAGVLVPGETGAVRVTVKPGLPSYPAFSRFGVSSSSDGSYAGSFVIERYVPIAPFTLDGLYPSLYVAFNEQVTSDSLSTGVTLAGAGADGTFDTADDVDHPLTLDQFTWDNRAVFSLGGAVLAPGNYRLTVAATVEDRSGNTLSTPYVGDFTILGNDGYVNEKGDNDSLATADTLSTNVAAGLPDGSFSNFGRNTATAGWPFDVELADFDDDGNLDAAVTHLGSVDGLRIYPGNGDKTFGTPVTFDGIGDEPHDAVMLDWDQDGDLDIAVTIHGKDAVGMFRNDSTPGAIAFTAMPNVTAGDQPRRAAADDLNGDGWPDLVVANYGTDGTTGRSISVLINDQAGSFSESKIGLALSPKIHPWGIALGDFNKDGNPDIVAGDTDNSGRIALFIGNGDGTFEDPTFLAMPSGPNVSDIAVADFNQDGNPDLAAVAYQNGRFDYWIFPGNGDGTFGARVDIDLSYGYYNHFVKAADVNGDGWPDLLIGGNDHLTVAPTGRTGRIGFDSVRRNWGDTYGIAAGT